MIRVSSSRGWIRGRARSCHAGQGHVLVDLNRPVHFARDHNQRHPAGQDEAGNHRRVAGPLDADIPRPDAGGEGKALEERRIPPGVTHFHCLTGGEVENTRRIPKPFMTFVTEHQVQARSGVRPDKLMEPGKRHSPKVETVPRPRFQLGCRSQGEHGRGLEKERGADGFGRRDTSVWLPLESRELSQILHGRRHYGRRRQRHAASTTGPG